MDSTTWCIYFGDQRRGRTERADLEEVGVRASFRIV